MKLRYKEDPKEWRKSVWLTALGLAVVSSLLRWRRILPVGVWVGVVGCLAVAAVAAGLRPNFFRGYYRVSLRLGYGLSLVLARVLLALIFFCLLTPLGLLLRALGKDPLRLKRPMGPGGYWTETKEASPLDRMF